MEHIPAVDICRRGQCIDLAIAVYITGQRDLHAFKRTVDLIVVDTVSINILELEALDPTEERVAKEHIRTEHHVVAALDRHDK